MNILIVEDEHLEREALGQLLRQGYGELITSIAYAEDGLAAVEHVSRYRPDTLFMDIHLPLLDGVEACRRIRAIAPEAEIVMVTAHSEFEYARQSIKNGVFDYMVKPYSVQTLNNTMDALLAARERRRRETAGEAERMTEMLGCEFMHKIMVNFRLSPEVIQDYVQMLELEQYWYSVMLIRTAGEDQAVKQWMVSALNQGEEKCLSSTFSRAIALILCERSWERVEMLTGQVVAALGGLPGYRGSCHSQPSDQWAQVAATFYTQLNRLNADQGVDLSEKRYMELERQLFDAVFSRDHEQIYTSCKGLVSSAFLRYGTSNDFGYYLIHLYQTLVRSVPGGDEQAMEGLYGQGSFAIPYRGNEERALEDLWENIQRLTTHLDRHMAAKSSAVVQQAQRFIQANYGENLSLEDIARHVSISKFYLSRMFKQTVGENIRDYILGVRIEQAKRILLEGKTAAETSDLVGFGDPAYFGKCFKRATGITPSQYVNQNRRKG